MSDLQPTIREQLIANDIDLEALQTNLHNAGFYGFNNKVLKDNADNIWGDDTYQAIMSFLKTGDNYTIIPDIKNDVVKRIRFEDEHRHDFAELERRAEALRSDIPKILGNRPPLNEEELGRLHEQLKEEGFYHGNVNAEWNWRTESAITSYIQRFPDTLAKTHPDILQDLITPNTPGNPIDEKSASSRLSILNQAANKSDLFNEKIDFLNGPLDMDPRDIPHYLEDLSVLLKIRGIYNGPIVNDHTDELNAARKYFEDEFSTPDVDYDPLSSTFGNAHDNISEPINLRLAFNDVKGEEYSISSPALKSGLDFA